MSKAKDLFFALRDRVRFIWARNKFTFMPFGKVEDFDLKQMRHIVILKVDGKLGDTQVMTHFYQTLREQIPDLTLSVVCPPSLAPIYADILGFDQVITSSKKPRKTEIEYICQKLTGPESACQYVDLVVTTEPHFKPRDFIFNYNLRPRYVAGCEPLLKGHEINLFLFDPNSDQRHISTCFTDFMTQGKLDFKPVHYEPLYESATLREVKAKFDCPVIGINPCGAAANRYLTVEMVSTLIKRISALYVGKCITVLLMCPPGQQSFIEQVKAQVGDLASSNVDGNANAGEHAAQQEHELQDSSATASASDDAVSSEATTAATSATAATATQNHLDLQTLPEVDVEGYAAYIGALSALITVDTAAVHLACASDIPQLCVYMGDGNTLNEKRWGPHSAVAEVLDSNTPERLDAMDSELFVSRSMSFLKRVLP